MPDPATATGAGGEDLPAEGLPASPPWYPFAELEPALQQLRQECNAAVEDAARAMREVGATFDALIAEAEQGFQRLRDAHNVIRDLDDEQAAAVLRRIRGKATTRRPVGFQPRGGGS